MTQSLAFIFDSSFTHTLHGLYLIVVQKLKPSLWCSWCLVARSPESRSMCLKIDNQPFGT